MASPPQRGGRRQNGGAALHRTSMIADLNLLQSQVLGHAKIRRDVGQKPIFAAVKFRPSHTFQT